MQIVFLKDHDVYKVDQKADLPDALANYLVRVSVAKPFTEKVEVAAGGEKETAVNIPGKVEIVKEKEKAEKVHKKEKTEK